MDLFYLLFFGAAFFVGGLILSALALLLAPSEHKPTTNKLWGVPLGCMTIGMLVLIVWKFVFGF